jgi:hypothetical protein
MQSSESTCLCVEYRGKQIQACLLSGGQDLCFHSRVCRPHPRLSAACLDRRRLAARYPKAADRERLGRVHIWVKSFATWLRPLQTEPVEPGPEGEGEGEGEEGDGEGAGARS